MSSMTRSVRLIRALLERARSSSSDSARVHYMRAALVVALPIDTVFRPGSASSQTEGWPDGGTVADLPWRYQRWEA